MSENPVRGVLAKSARSFHDKIQGWRFVWSDFSVTRQTQTLDHGERRTFTCDEGRCQVVMASPGHDCLFGNNVYLAYLSTSNRCANAFEAEKVSTNRPLGTDDCRSEMQRAMDWDQSHGTFYESGWADG